MQLKQLKVLDSYIFVLYLHIYMKNNLYILSWIFTTVLNIQLNMSIEWLWAKRLINLSPERQIVWCLHEVGLNILQNRKWKPQDHNNLT